MRTRTNGYELITGALDSMNLHMMLLSGGAMCVTLVTSLVNLLAGYPPYDGLMALAGLTIILLSYHLLFKRGQQQQAVTIVLLFFCFLYTPFLVFFFDGMTVHTSYVIIVIVSAVVLYTEGRRQRVILFFYGLSTLFYSAYDILLTGHDRHQATVELITFYTALGLLYLLMKQSKHVSRGLSSRLNELAHTDDLTKIYNNRYLYSRLEELEGSEEEYTILLFDLDEFKPINDTQGHLAGDLLLESLCHLVSRLLPQDSVFARYGGDEFIILLPHADEETAKRVSERVRFHVQEHTPITISMGVAFRRKHQEATRVLHSADQALYRAKKGGRNQVCFEVTS